MSTSMEPGWYVAAGDPAGTHRYWNGTQWTTDAQPIPSANPNPKPAASPAPQLAAAATASAAAAPAPGASTAMSTGAGQSRTAPERWTPDAAIAERAAEQAAAGGADTSGRPYDPFKPHGEAGEVDRTTASVWHRYLANAIDGAISGAVIGLITLLLIDRTGQTITGVETPLSWYVISFVFTAVYDIGLAMAFFATPGKLLMRIEIVSESGHHADSSALFVRGLVRFAVMLAWHVAPPIIGVFLFVYAMLNVMMIFFDPKRQSFPDKIAKTRVVKAEGLNQWNHQH